MMTRIDATRILEDVSFAGWGFRVLNDNSQLILQVVFRAACARTGEDTACSGRKWRLSPHMTKSEVVQTAFKAILTAVEHETREKFLYRGQSIFGPHFNVDKLVELCAAGNAEEVRS
jgi:hypothetical protein